MVMKASSIKELNSRAWYRLFKVLWIGGALLLLGLLNFANYYSYDSAYSYDRRTCLNNLTYLSKDEFDIVMRLADFYEGSLMYKFHLANCGYWKYEGSSYSGIETSKGFLDNVKNPNFSMIGTPRHKVQDFINFATSGHINNFLWNFFLWNSVILAIFELGRRVFYYIYFGSLRPPKN